MTEATGGITMTPPGEYEDDSVGIPLARRDRAAQRGGRAPGPRGRTSRGISTTRRIPEEGYWLKTGDIFHQRPSGHYEIVDRIKDIYKNSRGQTVAPAAVERLMDGVPGIRRTFLVGDGRDDNVLLIVPDRDDPVLAASPSPEDTDEYFRQIITTANRESGALRACRQLRSCSTAISRRARDELTPKGTLRRKVIEQHFAEDRSTASTRRASWSSEHARLQGPRSPAGSTATSASWRRPSSPRADGLFNRRTEALLPLWRHRWPGERERPDRRPRLPHWRATMRRPGGLRPPAPAVGRKPVPGRLLSVQGGVGPAPGGASRPR